MDNTGNRTCEPLQLPVLVKEISTCRLLLEKTQTCVYRSQYENVVKQGRYQLISIVNKIKAQTCQKPLPVKEDYERDIFMTEMESEFEEAKISHIRKEWMRQQKSMAELQERVYKKNRLLSLHSSYCSSQGSALCSILAVLMDNEDLVESFLTEADIYLVSFVKIANGCLFSFVRSYAFDEPVEDSTDFKYILALYTCISSISDSPSGRQFLLRRPECRVMLSELICILPYIKQTSSTTLKVILTKVLHDVTMEEDGVGLLHLCSEVLATLNSCIAQDYDPQIHKYLLEILERLTKQVPSQEFLDKLSDLINMERLNELSNRKYKDVNEIPRRIFQNIKTAGEEFLKQKQAEGDAPRSPSEDHPQSPRNKRKRALERKSTSPRHSKKIQTICFPHPCVSRREKFKSNEDLRTGSSSRLTTPATSSSTIPVIHSKNGPCSPEGRTRPCSRRNSSPGPLTICSSPYQNMFQISSEKTRLGSQRSPNGSSTCRSRSHSAGERTPQRSSRPSSAKKQECYATDNQLELKMKHKPISEETFESQPNTLRPPSSLKRTPGGTPKNWERPSSLVTITKAFAENEKRPCETAFSAPCKIKQTTCRPSSSNKQTPEKPFLADKQPCGSSSKIDYSTNAFSDLCKIQQTTLSSSSANKQSRERLSSANKPPCGSLTKVDSNKQVFSDPCKIQQSTSRSSSASKKTCERSSFANKQPCGSLSKVDSNKKVFGDLYRIQQTTLRPSFASEQRCKRPSLDKKQPCGSSSTVDSNKKPFTDLCKFQKTTLRSSFANKQIPERPSSGHKPSRGSLSKVYCNKKVSSTKNATQAQPKPLLSTVYKSIPSYLDFLCSKQTPSCVTRPEVELKPTKLPSQGSQPNKSSKPFFKYSCKIPSPKRSLLPVPKPSAANKRYQLAKPCRVESSETICDKPKPSSEFRLKRKTLELTDLTTKINKAFDRQPEELRKSKLPMPCSNRRISATTKTWAYPKAPLSSLSRVATNTSSPLTTASSKLKERTLGSYGLQSVTGKTSTCAPSVPCSRLDTSALFPVNRVSSANIKQICSSGSTSKNMLIPWTSKNSSSSTNILSSKSKECTSCSDRSKSPISKTSTCLFPITLVKPETIKQISSCEPTSKNMLIPWTPKSTVVSRLSQFDQQVRQCLRNSVRIISTLENRTSRLRQQRVLTKIKITGAPFKRFLTSRKDDFTST